MTRGQYKEKFKTCVHEWTLHMDADSGDRKSNSIFICDKCKTIVTMLERNSLDSLILQEKAIKDSLASQKESQKIQERTLKMSMWANVISAILVCIALVALLFGEGIVGLFSKEMPLEKGQVVQGQKTPEALPHKVLFRFDLD